MRAVSPALPSRLPPGGRRVASLDAFSRTEKIIAFCRVLLATATLAVVIVDPRQPSFSPNLAYVILTAYVAYSIALFLIVRGEHVRQEPAPLRTAITGTPHVGPW